MYSPMEDLIFEDFLERDESKVSMKIMENYKTIQYISVPVMMNFFFSKVNEY